MPDFHTLLNIAIAFRGRHGVASVRDPQLQTAVFVNEARGGGGGPVTVQ